MRRISFTVCLLLLPFAASFHITAATSARRSRPIIACDAPPADPPRIISFSDAALAQV